MSISEATGRGPMTHLRDTSDEPSVLARVARWLLRLPTIGSFAYLFFFEGHYTTLGVGLSLFGLLLLPVLAQRVVREDSFWNVWDGDGDGDDGDGCGGGCGGGD